MDRSLGRQVRSIKCAVAILITLILVLFPVFSSGCGATEWKPRVASSPGTMLTLNRADNGKSIAMQVNDLLVVSLDENPTTGFQWAIADSSNLVALQATDYLPAPEPGIGGGGQRILTFKALRAGTAKLQIKLWREWEGDKSIAERFTVTLEIRE